MAANGGPGGFWRYATRSPAVGIVAAGASGFREERSTHPTCVMSAHEKARRGFPPGRNFGVSISLVDGFGGRVKDFDPIAIRALHRNRHPAACGRTEPVMGRLVFRRGGSTHLDPFRAA